MERHKRPFGGRLESPNAGVENLIVQPTIARLVEPRRTNRPRTHVIAPIVGAKVSVPPILSILVCTLPSRVSQFLPEIIKQLDQQSKGKPVQVLYLGDNKGMSVGKKRNHLLHMAEGKYLAFVDDDDILAEDYIDSLLKAAETDADCLLFDVPVSINGNGFGKVTHFSLKNTNQDFPTHYERKPCHVTATKSSIAKSIPFPDISAGEDYEWQSKLVTMLKTEHQIGKSLYFYDYSVNTSETTGNMR